MLPEVPVSQKQTLLTQWEQQSFFSRVLSPPDEFEPPTLSAFKSSAYLNHFAIGIDD